MNPAPMAIVMITEVAAGIIPVLAQPDQPDGLAEPGLMALDCTGQLVDQTGAVLIDDYRVRIALPIEHGQDVIGAIAGTLTALATDRPLVAFTRQPYPTDPEPAP